MLLFSSGVLSLSIFISVLTAALVYLALHWLFMRPMTRLIAGMAVFCEAPEEGACIIRPSGRRDEIDVAEQVLAEMQRQIRDALVQQSRLAGVGMVCQDLP
ncbi:MAG: sensor signal transduction histidine kinase [Rhodospirillaceae bacterium]|nr:MAG: sensor signal transduction histidine kinase [Rhodospirillaceae bacterium]